MNDAQTWYVVKRSDESCEILPNTQVEAEEESAFEERWGPFESQHDAITRRVGLIRSGKCKPS